MDGLKLIICVRKNIGLTRKKLVDQIAKASFGLFRSVTSKKSKKVFKLWEKKFNRETLVFKIEKEEDIEAIQDFAETFDINYYVQEDNCLEEIEPMTKTVLVVGPAYNIQIDPIIENLEPF